ncbi:unnamed protein product [Discosporangium mesarthrocarpum]
MFPEAETWENDLLTSAVDGIGWVIKTKQAAFLPLFESKLFPLVSPVLGQGTLGSLRSFGLCMCIDIVEHCGEGGQGVIPTLLPALLQASKQAGYRRKAHTHGQACAYGLGAVAEHGGDAFNAEASRSVALLARLIQDRVRHAQRYDPKIYTDMQTRMADRDPEDSDKEAVFDNAVSALLKLMIFRGPAIEAGGGSLLSCLPLKRDMTEAHDCHRRVVDLALDLDPLVVGVPGAGGGPGSTVGALVAAIAGMMGK